MNCKKCNEIIPDSHVQQGGMHIGCYNEEIEVFKICLEGTCYFDEYFPVDHKQYEIEKVKMTYGEFLSLPELEGF
jgi:hypothetical protein